jgi:hypothetical protein
MPHKLLDTGPISGTNLNIFHILVREGPVKMKALVALLLLSVWKAFAEPFANPLKTQTGSDPWMTYHESYYYLLVTGWTEVAITRAKTVNGLKHGETKVIYKVNGGDRCCNVWAPGKRDNT